MGVGRALWWRSQNFTCTCSYEIDEDYLQTTVQQNWPTFQLRSTKFFNIIIFSFPLAVQGPPQAHLLLLRRRTQPSSHHQTSQGRGHVPWPQNIRPQRSHIGEGDGKTKRTSSSYCKYTYMQVHGCRQLFHSGGGLVFPRPILWPLLQSLIIGLPLRQQYESGSSLLAKMKVYQGLIYWATAW